MQGEAAPVAPGDVLAGKYRVERVLGMGGMGVVVSAMHLDLGQRVALKFLLPQALENAEAAARFLREARAAVKIDSEHVARVIDVGRLESGAPYMVMEYLEGQDLADHPKGGGLPIEDAVDFLLQACEAMAVAHALGIVHRDLKPANLFLARRPDGSPVVKVLDFGISKLNEQEAGRVDLTQTSAVMGSPLYMSPEQMRSARNVDARSDLWSLGTILYELIGGEPPFNGETLGEVFAAVMTTPHPPVATLRPDVSPRLEAVISRALEKDPARRYQNVAELAAALAEFAPQRSQLLVERVSAVLSRAGIATKAQPAAQAAPPREVAVAGATNTSWEDATGRLPSSPSRVPLIAAAALLVVGIGAGVAFKLRAPAPVPAPESAPAAISAAQTAPVATAAAVATNPPPTVEPAAAPLVAAPVVEPSPSAEPARPRLAVAKRAAEAPAKARPAAPPAPVAAPAPTPPSAAKKNPLSIDFK